MCQSRLAMSNRSSSLFGVCVTALLATLLAPWTVALPNSTLRARHLVNSTELKDDYDYVIIGGGTAGLTIADRLSAAAGDVNVLVIESGDMNTGLYAMRSVPQTELNNRVIRFGMGHTVGGSSAVNGMAVMRGTEADYNIWAELGNEGSTWGWDHMIPIFKKAIHFRPPPPELAEDYNITYDIDAAWGQYEDTKVYASFPGGFSPRIKTIYNALKSVPGITFPRDGHAGSNGVFFYPVSVDPDTRQRSYSRTGHWNGLDRDNYDLLTSTRVNKIIIEDGAATGVQFRDGNDTVIVKAGKEIILSAGAIHTPQVLQLSGVGPKKLLKKAGIEVHSDLPGVGSNFQDHPIGPGVSFRFNQTPPTPEVLYNDTIPSEGRGQGLVSFLSLPITTPETFEQIASDYESQNLADYLPAGTDCTVLAGYKAQQKIYAREMRGTGLSFMNYIVSGAAGGTPINLHTTSRGSITINVTDPEGDPIVDYRALTNPTDIDLMIAYMNFLRRFFTTGDLEQYNATEVRPGADVTSREDLADYVRASYNPTGWHPVGTAPKMRRELGGVVDDELRVYGVERLRVADASIFPTLIGGTTQLTAYAVGEKAAEFIIGGWDGMDEEEEEEVVEDEGED